MPYVHKRKSRFPVSSRYKTKTRFRKKIPKRFTKSRFNKQIMRVPKGLIVPRRFFTKLFYHSSQYEAKLDATGNLNSSVIFRSASIFDPEYAVGGNQPIGFDYIKTIYQQYKVHACGIMARVYNKSSAVNGAMVYLTIYPTTLPQGPATFSSDWGMIAGQPNARHKYMSTAVTQEVRQNRLRHKIKTKTVLGVRDIQDQSWATNIGSNPQSEGSHTAPHNTYYIVTLWNADRTTTTVTYLIDVTLTYYVEFMNPFPMIDQPLQGDPDGTNDTPPSFSGGINVYQPAFGGSGSQSMWLDGSD